LKTQSLKAEIRSYIRHHRKELTHDKLTGLRNREILLDRIEHGLEQAKRNRSLVAVLYIGLDRFKEINASLGHAAGDQLLRCYASRLTAVSRASDTLVRVEGDEFALLITGVKNTEEIEHIANRVVKIFRTPVELSDKQYSVSASIGIALDEQYSVNNETLVLNAYAAMKEVKKQGGGNIYQFFVREMKKEPVKQTSKEAELYRALDNEEFRLYYQPQVDMASGTIKGMEAILRWQHPHRGLVSPNEFIPFLEETGLIVTVGEWVLREACRVSKLWQNEGLPAVRVSVNVSPVQLKQQGFAELVKEVLDSSGLDPAHLMMEMTESCLMADDENIVHLLNELKKLGVSISVDNFGSGYSSLSRLKRFPVDMLKIDRSFITNLQDRQGNDNADIVSAIMALSHSLQLEVVAKGVETQEELEYLNALGCCTIQGFLYSQPVSAYEFQSLLRASTGQDESLVPAQTA
jgi:diguanylate cyclase (GGDEF)-like protein